MKYRNSIYKYNTIRIISLFRNDRDVDYCNGVDKMVHQIDVGSIVIVDAVALLVPVRLVDVAKDMNLWSEQLDKFL